MPVQKDKTQEEYLKSVGRHMVRRRKFTYKRVDVSKLKCKITRILSEEKIAKEYKKTKKAEKFVKKREKGTNAEQKGPICRGLWYKKTRFKNTGLCLTVTKKFSLVSFFSFLSC